MRTFFLVPFLVLAACAKEKPVGKVPPVVAKEGGITTETDVPGDADSRKFADHIVRHGLANFTPADGNGGAGIKWKTVTFGPKNHWEAAAELSAGGESVNCTEAGHWSMDKAEAPERATITLETKKSDCPGRSDSTTYRLLLTYEGDNYNVVFR